VTAQAQVKVFAHVAVYPCAHNERLALVALVPAQISDNERLALVALVTAQVTTHTHARTHTHTHTRTHIHAQWLSDVLTTFSAKDKYL
jgi:hypothetical protein